MPVPWTGMRESRTDDPYTPGPSAGPAGAFLVLLVLEVIAQGDFRTTGRLRIRFPVRAELVVLERPDAEPDLPLRRNELDDLHLVGLAHRELELPVLARLLRVVELRHVDQPFDAFHELHE